MGLRKLYSGALLALFCVGAGTAAVLRTWIRGRSGPTASSTTSIFASGETLPELRIHYTYLGKPKKDALGRVTNAVLIMHGTGGSGRSLINDRFSGVLFKKAAFWTRTSTTSFFRTASVTGLRASRAMACGCVFPNIHIRIWCWRNTSWSPRVLM